MSNASGSLQDGLVEELGETLDLDGLLLALLRTGASFLKCQRASVFLFNPAIGRLELATMHPDGCAPLSFKPGEGLAGEAWREGRPKLWEGKELQVHFVERGPFSLEHRAVYTFPIVTPGGSGGVVCFDFIAPSGEGSTPLTRQEREWAEVLGATLADSRVSNAIRRARTVHGLAEITKAGSAQYRLRVEVGSFLEGFTASFGGSGFNKPDLLYLQIADHRQKKIRTIQGYGLPLSAQVSISHSLESKDIQACVARTGSIELIAGYDERFDRVVFDRFGHAEFVRIWLPLFPLDFAKITDWARRPLDRALSDALVWSGIERSKERTRRSAHWSSDLQPKAGLIFGTLEVGYWKPENCPEGLEPWSEELALFCVADALQRADRLFRVTLQGSLDTIGRHAAGLAMGPTAPALAMAVTLPDRSHYEVRGYPPEDESPVANPVIEEWPSGGSASLLEWSYPGSGQVLDEPALALRVQTEVAAEEAVRVALRLDDQMSEAFSLIELVEDPLAAPGTAWPDTWLEEFGRDAAREAGAVAAEVFLFEGRNGKRTVGGEASDAVPLFPSSSQGQEGDSDPRITTLGELQAVAATGRASYGSESGAPVALVPLELADNLTAVLRFRFKDEAGKVRGPHERLTLEARVVRWVHRLSLRRLVTEDRFAAVLSTLRDEVAAARADLVENGEERLVTVFARNLLGKLSKALSFGALPANAIVLTMPASTASAPKTLERWWRFGEDEGSHEPLQEDGEGPCQKAMNSGEIRVYQPQDDRRSGETKGLCRILEDSSLASREDMDLGGLAQLKKAIRGEDSSTTLVVIPASNQAALSIILEGEHYFAYQQRSLLGELGSIIGRVLNEVRQLDKTWLAQQVSSTHKWRAEIDKARTVDEVLSAAIDALGSLRSRRDGRRSSESLASKGVIWLLSRDRSELAPRVTWGLRDSRGLLSSTVAPKNHPLLEREWRNITKPKHDHPKLKEPTEALLFPSSAFSRMLAGSAHTPETEGWWVSSLLAGADGTLVGVLDFIVPVPPLPEVHDVVNDLMRRLGRQVAAAIARTRLDRCEALARNLNRHATVKIRTYQLENLWKDLAESCQKELACKDCDLFFEYMGQVVLRGTTRKGIELSGVNPLDLWVEPRKAWASRAGEEASNRPAILRREGETQGFDTSHIASSLHECFAGPPADDLLMIPVLPEEGPASPEAAAGLLLDAGRPASKASASRACEAILVAHGPFTRTSGLTVLEKRWSSRPDQADMDLAVGLSRVILRVARVVRVVEEQNLLINEMVHSLAHPLQGIRGHAENFLRDLAAGQTVGGVGLRERRKRIENAFALAEESRDQLGFLAKLGQPRILGPTEQIDVWILVEDCCSAWENLAGERAVRIHKDLGKAFSVAGYKRWLRLAVSNVIHNAIKYSFANREVAVTLRRSDAQMLLTVENSGVGVPRDDKDRVFDLYFRSRVADSKGQREGMGIGLAITREAVRLHHGTVTITSAPLAAQPDGRERAARNEEKRVVGSRAEDIVDIEHKTRLVIELPCDRRGEPLP